MSHHNTTTVCSSVQNGTGEKENPQSIVCFNMESSVIENGLYVWHFLSFKEYSYTLSVYYFTLASEYDPWDI